MNDRGKLVLEGMEFFGRHGAMVEEARLGGRFRVDLELEFEHAGADRLDTTVDYSRVYGNVERLVTGSRHLLIESLAAAIARMVLNEERLVERVTVRVHKPHAPLPGVVRDVYAQVTRERSA